MKQLMKQSGKKGVRSFLPMVVAGVLSLTAGVSQAAIWSDTSIGFRMGSDFREPYNTEKIGKKIFNLTHVSGYKYGKNFFNVDFLMSDSKDPAGTFTSGNGAHETYLVYRHFLDLGAITGKEMKFGPVRGVGLTAGFDWNTKNDAGYQSKKRMLVLGPTVSFDVPGFLDVSLLALHESNAPSGLSGATGLPYSISRYTYDIHPMLTAAWGIPIGNYLSFEGYANWIAAKGTDEFGYGTKPELLTNLNLMLDAGKFVGLSDKTFRVGLGYEYWRNKFGNHPNINPFVANVAGTKAKTPMLLLDSHF